MERGRVRTFEHRDLWSTGDVPDCHLQRLTWKGGFLEETWGPRKRRRSNNSIKVCASSGLLEDMSDAVGDSSFEYEPWTRKRLRSDVRTVYGVPGAEQQLQSVTWYQPSNGDTGNVTEKWVQRTEHTEETSMPEARLFPDAPGDATSITEDLNDAALPVKTETLRIQRLGSRHRNLLEEVDIVTKALRLACETPCSSSAMVNRATASEQTLQNQSDGRLQDDLLQSAKAAIQTLKAALAKATGPEK